MNEISERRPKGEGSVYQRRDTGRWYFKIKFQVGDEERELREPIPGEFADADAAWKSSKTIRQECIAKIKRNEVQPSKVENLTCGELLTQYVAHVHKNRPLSAKEIVYQVEGVLRPYFGGTKVAKLTTDTLDGFVKHREKQGRMPATIKNDLAYFRSALRLELKRTPCRVGSIPYFPTIRVDNVRKGFIEFDLYERLLDHLPVSLKCLFVVAYHIGNRKTAMLELKWHQIDFDLGVIFLDSQHRNKTAGTAPICGDMREWLERQKQFRDQHFPNCEHVFFWYPQDCEIDPYFKSGHGGHRSAPGTQIKVFKGSWAQAVKDAGVPGLLFHDLRRSAVRNMVQKMKVGEKLAMDITGHKTRAMLDRYNIVAVQDVQDSGNKMDLWVSAQRKPKVVEKAKVKAKAKVVKITA